MRLMETGTSVGAAFAPRRGRYAVVAFAIACSSLYFTQSSAVALAGCPVYSNVPTGCNNGGELFGSVAVSGVYTQAYIDQLDEPTTCGVQGVPMRCPPNTTNQINGANVRPTQIVMTIPDAARLAGDFVAMGYGLGCARAAQNSDPMGHCTTINNGIVSEMVYVDGSANGIYTENWKPALSIPLGSTQSFWIQKNSSSGCWDYFLTSQYFDSACGQAGDAGGPLNMGSESATGGASALYMYEYSYHDMYLLSGGTWYLITGINTVATSPGCGAVFFLYSGTYYGQTSGRC